MGIFEGKIKFVQILAKVNSFFYGQLPYSGAHFCGLSSVLTYFRQKKGEGRMTFTPFGQKRPEV